MHNVVGAVAVVATNMSSGTGHWVGIWAFGRNRYMVCITLSSSQSQVDTRPKQFVTGTLALVEGLQRQKFNTYLQKYHA